MRLGLDTPMVHGKLSVESRATWDLLPPVWRVYWQVIDGCSGELWYRMMPLTDGYRTCQMKGCMTARHRALHGSFRNLLIPFSRASVPLGVYPCLRYYENSLVHEVLSGSEIDL